MGGLLIDDTLCQAKDADTPPLMRFKMESWAQCKHRAAATGRRYPDQKGLVRWARGEW